MTGRRDPMVSGLIKKRRELARLIETLQEQLDQCRADLAHIDTAKGLDAGDATFRASVRQRLRTILTRLRKQGVIEAVSSGRGSKWKLAVA